jgi:hypothetical protein
MTMLLTEPLSDAVTVNVPDDAAESVMNPLSIELEVPLETGNAT